MRERQPEIPDNPDLALLSAEYISFSNGLLRDRKICEQWRAAQRRVYGAQAK